MRHPISFLVLGLLLAFSAPGATEDVSGQTGADSAAASLHRYLSLFRSIRANFIQRGQASEGVASDGEFWLRKPASFRVVTGPPISQTIVSDGSSLWTYDMDLEQVIISDLDRDAREIPLLLLAADADEIKAFFLVEAYHDGHKSLFSLTPRDADTLLKKLRLLVVDGKPAAINVEAGASGHSFIELSEVELDPEIADDIFRFHVPDTADVIDDRSPHAPARAK